MSARETNKRPLIFLLVGIFNTLADFAFYSLLTLVFLTANNQIGLAGIISGTFALVCAFLTHSFITWRGSNIGHRTVLKFIAFTGFGMWVIRPLLLSLFIMLDGLYNWVFSISDGLSLPFTKEFIANTGAFGFMVILLLLYNYFVYERFVFADKPAKD
jgi:putative flippase GtrA